MITKKKYASYDQGDGKYYMAQESIHSQTIEQRDLAVNQHDHDQRTADHQPTELDHDDADRRTLDESQADEDDED